MSQNQESVEELGRKRFVNEAYLRRGKCRALRGRMQGTARTDAVHCRGGCSALRLRWVKLAPKWSVVFWIREKGDNGIMTKR